MTLSSSSTFAVRMDMPERDAAALDSMLLRCPPDVADAVMDQLWLRTVLIEQRRRMRIEERAGFTVRGDRILVQLDPRDPGYA